jgi:tetratricopeptide (TPR) repeat protein
MEDELALFNKVGDLYQKAGNVQAAVDMWERGVNHYADGGFHNNAIALCNKILRNAPARTQVYLMLAKLMLGRGFVAEAKQHLLEYAERMKKVGQLDAAFTALKEFADLSAGDNDEIRLLLAEQLKAGGRHSEAREQLAKLYHETKGDARRSRMTVEKMKAIDPDYDVEKAPEPKQKPKKTKSSDLVFLDLARTRAAPRPRRRHG